MNVKSPISIIDNHLLTKTNPLFKSQYLVINYVLTTLNNK